MVLGLIDQQAEIHPETEPQPSSQRQNHSTTWKEIGSVDQNFGKHFSLAFPKENPSKIRTGSFVLLVSLFIYFLYLFILLILDCIIYGVAAVFL